MQPVLKSEQEHHSANEKYLYEDTSLIGPEISGPTAEHKLAGEDRTFDLSIAPIWELPIGR
jgi:hypothetical protein